jgi:hypothetical protein
MLRRSERKAGGSYAAHCYASLVRIIAVLRSGRESRGQCGLTRQATAWPSGGVPLRCAAVVAVVQAADQWNGDDATQRGWRDRPRVRRVLRQREMRSRLVVVRHVPTQDANQSSFIHDDHVIEALASDGADEPLCIRVLPRRTRGGAEFLDAHATRCRGERSKRVVAIMNEIARSCVFGKRLAELLRGPRGGRMRGDRTDAEAADDALDAAVTIFHVLSTIVNPFLRQIGIAPVDARIGMDLGPFLRARIGVPTGGARQTRNFLTAVGAVANIACRLQQAAGTNEIFVGDLVFQNARSDRLNAFSVANPAGLDLGVLGNDEPYWVWRFNEVRNKPISGLTLLARLLASEDS